MSSAMRSSVSAATATFHQALRTDDVATFTAYLADDVVLMPPGEPAVRGRDAVRNWYEDFVAQYRTATLVLTDTEVFVGDEWAVETGAYEWGLMPAGGGAAVVGRGSYMQVWQATADGQWRFAREVWNQR